MSEPMNAASGRRASRRAFLRGAGRALTLPWLESLAFAAGESTAKPANKPPLRFACVYFSNGVEPEHWWAKGSGASMEFGKGLAPIAPHREEIVFLKGL